MHSGLFYWQSVFISEVDLPGLVPAVLCLAHINNKPVKTFYLKIEKLFNLRQGRHDTRHHTHGQASEGHTSSQDIFLGYFLFCDVLVACVCSLPSASEPGAILDAT